MLRKERLREAGKHGGGGRLARGELGSGGKCKPEALLHPGTFHFCIQLVAIYIIERIK